MNQQDRHTVTGGPHGTGSVVPARGFARRTEVGGWQAVWRPDQHGVRILQVRNLSNAQVPWCFAACSAAPDLADMRDRLPGLSPLWDAVRREFWAYALLEGTIG